MKRHEDGKTIGVSRVAYALLVTPPNGLRLGPR